MLNVLKSALRQPWLSGGSVWAIAVASAALNAWGWAETATGLVGALLVTLAVSSEVLGVRLAFALERRHASRAWLSLAVGCVLMTGVVGFNAYSGHRALVMVERSSSAPHDAYLAAVQEARAELARIDAEIAAVPALPANVPTVRLREYRAARDAELDRLNPQREEARAALERIPVVEPPPPAIDDQVIWLIVALVEALKALALWVIAGGGERRPVNAQPNEGSALAARRWEKVKAAKAAATA